MVILENDFDPENEDSLGKEDLGGFDYLLYDDAGDMVDYITRTVQKIKL